MQSSGGDVWEARTPKFHLERVVTLPVRPIRHVVPVTGLEPVTSR